MYFSVIESPIDDLMLIANEQGLTGLYMKQSFPKEDETIQWKRCDERLSDARRQIVEYFQGERQVFDLPLSPLGTPFQMKVWEALQRIPYGTTISYGELAHRIGQPTASRAVGAANGKNPISIIVPCHRVIGASGALTGFGGGIDRKRFLLDLEGQSHETPQLSLPGFDA